MSVANVVSGERHGNDHRVVQALIPLQRFHAGPGVRGPGAIHGDVLIVVPVAPVSPDELLVQAPDGVVGVVDDVARGGRLVRPVELVRGHEEQVVEGALFHLLHVDPAGRDLKMRAGAVANHDDASLPAVRAEELLVGLLLDGLGAVDAVAVVVDFRLALPLLSARVDLAVEVVAVFAPPVVPAEGRERAEGVVVEVHDGLVLVAEFVREQVDYPLPRGRRNLLRGEIPQSLKGRFLRVNFAVWKFCA
jgi:hypothetical protein